MERARLGFLMKLVHGVYLDFCFDRLATFIISGKKRVLVPPSSINLSYDIPEMNLWKHSVAPPCVGKETLETSSVQET